MLLLGFTVATAFCQQEPEAKADPFGYPCQYPGIGFGAEIFGISGQFCDYPTEANGTHWHCESGGLRTGGVGVATSQGVSLGALASLGASGEGCSFRCPDGTVAPSPNPPGDWKTYLIPRLSFCKDHAVPAGPTSALVSIDEGAKPPPPGTIQPGQEPDIPEQQPPEPPQQPLGEPQPQGEIPIPPVPGIPALPVIPLP